MAISNFSAKLANNDSHNTTELNINEFLIRYILISMRVCEAAVHVRLSPEIGLLHAIFLHAKISCIFI